MLKRQFPTIQQANITYFIIAVFTLAGSFIFIPIRGIGTNLWINEFVYILFPALLLAGINRWNMEDVYRYKGTSGKNAGISILLGICTWFIAAYITKLIDILLNISIGTIKIEAFNNTSLNQSLLLLIGMVILAPICEETLFRGFIQKAYEGHSKKYGFVFTALLFGFFHILNGVKDVIPAFIIGFVLGYIVYQTGSITGSMLAHAANNLCAIIFGGIIATGIPAWFNYVSIAALVIIIFLLRSLKSDQGHNETTSETQSNGKTPIIAIIFLILSLILMLCVGIMEIMTRAGIIG